MFYKVDGGTKNSFHLKLQKPPTVKLTIAATTPLTVTRLKEFSRIALSFPSKLHVGMQHSFWFLFFSDLDERHEATRSLTERSFNENVLAYLIYKP